MSTTTNFAHSEFTFHGDSAYLMSLSEITEASFTNCELYGLTYQVITNGLIFDAEKNRNETRDDDMCWAATASNMLAWTGWGAFARGLEQNDAKLEDKIFWEFKNSFQYGYVYGAPIKHGLAWFADGSWEGQPKRDEPLENTGNYLGLSFFCCPDIEEDSWDKSYISSYCSITGPDNFTSTQSDTIKMMKALTEALQNGNAVGLTVARYNASHAVTCWGYTHTNDSFINIDDPRYYTGLFISDSDDNKEDTVESKDRIRYVPLLYNYEKNMFLYDTIYSEAIEYYYLAQVDVLKK